MVDSDHVGCRLRTREIARRTGGLEVRTGPLERRGVGVRGDDRGAQAGDRDPQARQVWPQCGTHCPAHRPAGTAARGAGNRRGRGRHPRRAGDRQDGEGSSLRPAQAGEEGVPRTSAARAGGGRGPSRLHVLRVGADREDGRGCHRNAGGGAASREGDPDRPREVHLPRLREDQPVPGPVPPRSTPFHLAGPVRACWP